MPAGGKSTIQEGNVTRIDGSFGLNRKFRSWCCRHWTSSDVKASPNPGISKNLGRVDICRGFDIYRTSLGAALDPDQLAPVLTRSLSRPNVNDDGVPPLILRRKK
jgi:hypothetical protein